MSNMTINDAIQARSDAEKAIAEILTNLVKKTGAGDISVYCDPFKHQPLGAKCAQIVHVKCSIKIEI